MKLINKLFQLVLLPLIIAGAFFVWSLPRITTDYNVNTDELIYLSRSNYWTAYKTGDFHNPIWSNPWVVYDQPQLTNYIFAAVPGDRALLDPNNSPCDTHSQGDFYASWSCLDGPPISTWPESTKKLRDLVVSGRILATAISSIAVATTYYLGLVVAGPLAGIIASLYLGWYSYFRNLSTMIMEDQTLLIFLNLQLISTLLLVRCKKPQVILYLTLAISTGLAFSTKLSAAIPTLITYLYLVFESLRQKHIKLALLLTSAFLTVAVFISLHPFTWGNPVGEFIKMIDFRTTQIANQSSPIYTPKGIVDKLNYFVDEAFSPWTSTTQLTQIIPVVTIFLLSLALLSFTTSSFTLISLFQILVFMLILPIKWNRYLLPIMPIIAVMLGSFPTTIAVMISRVKIYWVQIRHFGIGAISAVLILGIFALLYPLSLVNVIILATTLLLTLQGYLVTRAMLYSFSHRDKQAIPDSQPQHTFSLIIPAKNEPEVIGHTIASVAKLNYPQDLYEVLVVIRSDDLDTLSTAREAITSSSASNIKIVEIDGFAKNKAYSLNLGTHMAKYGYIGIFDAEDEPNVNILRKVNDYLMAHPTTHAVQAPVHLTNLTSTWFSSLNAVEYYFWFRSVLPYLKQGNTIPLGGNTIFVHRLSLKNIGGYDEECLTEDAELGIRLSSAEANIGIIDDPTLATREETPGDEFGLIRQRSRWDQGYLQVLYKGSWSTLPLKQQLMTIYILTQPIFRHLSFLNMIFSPLLASLGFIPMWIALISFLPGYFLLIQLSLYCLGLGDLSRLHQIKISPWRYIYMLLAFIPYQALLTLSTLRALGKLAIGNYNWDKTAHTNSHRTSLAILEA